MTTIALFALFIFAVVFAIVGEILQYKGITIVSIIVAFFTGISTVFSFVLYPVAPNITPTHPEQEEGTVVSIACDMSFCDIYYTTDGSDAKNRGELYSEPFVLNETCTVSARAKFWLFWGEPEEMTYRVYPEGAEEYIAVEDIDIGRESVAIEQGCTTTLMAVVTPANATEREVVWYSEDPGIAAVNGSGTITGMMPGHTIIHALDQTGEVDVKCEVTVKGTDAGDISGDGWQSGGGSEEWSTDEPNDGDEEQTDDISTTETDLDEIPYYKLNAYAVEMYVGEKQYLAVFEGENIIVDTEIFWWSDCPEIADVSQYGELFANSPGICNVQAIIGETVLNCSIEVLEAEEVWPETVAIVDAPDILYVGESYWLEAEVYPWDANQNVIWAFDDTDIGWVDADGLLYAESPGTLWIWGISEADEEIYDFFKVEIIEPDVRPTFSMEIDSLYYVGRSSWIELPYSIDMSGCNGMAYLNCVLAMDNVVYSWEEEFFPDDCYISWLIISPGDYDMKSGDNVQCTFELYYDGCLYAVYGCTVFVE